MKTKLFTRIAFLIALVCSSFQLNAASGSWNLVGAPGISAGLSYYNDIASDGLGNKYIVYRDGSLSGRATVKKFDGTNWNVLGLPGFSTGIADFCCIAVTGAGTPFVAFRDASLSNKITVMKYNGTAWVLVGNAGFTPGGAVYLQMVLNAANQPTIAFRDLTNADKLSVWYFNGTWTPLGTGLSIGFCEFPSIAISNFGNVFVTYKDYGLGGKICVKRYDGFFWNDFGGPFISTAVGYYPSIDVDGAGIPFVAYSDHVNLRKLIVKKFSGGTWIPVGSINASSDRADLIDMVIDNTGKPVVAYKDVNLGGGISCVRFDGATWNYLGSSNFSASGQVNYVNLIIDPSGAPFAVYQDAALAYKPSVRSYDGILAIMQGGGNSANINNLGTIEPSRISNMNGGTSVNKMNNNVIDENTSLAQSLSEAIMVGEKQKEEKTTNNANTLKELSFYPNPSTGIINFDSKEAISISIYDLTGKQVQYSIVDENSIDLSAAENGIYILKATTADGVFTRRILKQN